MEDYTKNLRSASSSQNWEDDDSPEPKTLPVVPVEVSESSDEERAEDERVEQLRREQLKRDEELAREIEDAEQWELERFETVKQRELEAARHRELEAAKERELEAAKERELEAARQQLELEAAKEREREAAEEKVRMIMQIMEEQEKKRKEEDEQQPKNVPGQRHRREPKAKQKAVSSDESEEESSEEESSEDEIVRWAMKEATAKRKAREANRKTRDQTLHAHMNALNIRQPYYGGPIPGMGPGIWSNDRSGNVTTSIRTNVGNDNSTYIKKGMFLFSNLVY